VNHYIITIFLSFILYVIFNWIHNQKTLYNLLLFLLALNLLSFNIYLIFNGVFNYQIHLPLHLCYLTEIGILASILFHTKFYYPWLLLNGLGGGITGFLNSNLMGDAMLIEHIHLYLSHFNLLLFSLILYKANFFISRSDFLKSIAFNLFLFISVIFFNIKFHSNYWFTSSKPPGMNLTSILPEWPYYLLILIGIGITSYYITFKLFSKNFNIN